MKMSGITYCLMCLLLAGCGGVKETRDLGDVYRFVNDPENGLVREKVVKGLKLKARWIPASQLAYIDYKDSGGLESRDQLMADKAKQVCIVLSLTPTGVGETDLMKVNIPGQAAYADRMVNLNFHLGEEARLIAGENVFYPAGYHLENTYGLTKDRDIHFVFAPEAWEVSGPPEEFTFEFNDPEFGTGTHLFKFRRKDMEQAPQLIF